MALFEAEEPLFDEVPTTNSEKQRQRKGENKQEPLCDPRTAKENERLLNRPAVKVETVRKIPMLTPVVQTDARVESDKEQKITERKREQDLQIMAEAGDNERGN